MRYQRTVRPLRSQVPAAPLVTVFFLLLIFLIPSALVYTPGVHLQLPITGELPGTDKPSVSVAVDAGGRLFFQNQMIEETDLSGQLRAAARSAPEPLTLIVHADRSVTYEHLVRLTEVARQAGIQEAVLATMPRTLGRAPSSIPEVQ